MREGVAKFGPARIAAVSALLVGIVAVLVVVSSSNGTYRLTAVFDQVNGLIEGADVMSGGVTIGKVEEIDLGRDGYPRVEMEIDDDFRVHAGGGSVLASQRPFSVSGTVSRFVGLTQGNGRELPDGAVIPRERTSAVLEFDQVLSTLDPATRADTRELMDRFDKAVAERGPDIERTLRHSAEALGATADLAAQLNSDGEALRTLVTRGREVVSAIEQDPGSLGAFAERMSGFLATTAARQRDLAATVEGMPRGLSTGRRALDRLDASIDNLSGLVRDARPGVRKLSEVSPRLRAFLASLRPAAAELNTLIRRGPADLRRIDPLLRTARPTFRAFIPALESSIPIFNESRARLPDALAFFETWADHTASYDANGHAGRVGLVHTNTPTNPIGPSESGPGRLRLPYLRDPGVLEGDPWADYRETFVGLEGE